MENKWESIDEMTNRMPVPGGWLVLHRSKVAQQLMVHGQPHRVSEPYTVAESMCFVPDPKHTWMP